MSRRTAAKIATSFSRDDAEAALAGAILFVPPGRGEAMLRKWLEAALTDETSEYRKTCAAADAMLLTRDLIVSQPSASGATAFDRMARQQVPATEAARAALASLRAARFRLLRLDSQSGTGHATAVDVISGDTLDLVPADLPILAAGIMLFARVAMLDGSSACLVGAVTPLDEAATRVARQHPAAGRPGAVAGARWAEAVYGHVVRCGTLDVPDLNRPRDGTLDDEPEDNELLSLALAWADLGTASPDADLLERTRLMTATPVILDGLAAVLMIGAAGQEKLASAFRRLLQVQVETVLRREQIGCGALTMDVVLSALDARIARGQMPATARALLEEVRESACVGCASPTANDAGLARLMQRLRGLRAKTVAQGCTEQEALAAAQKVAELLDRHGLSLNEAEFQAQPCTGIAVETGRRRLHPLDECVPAVADFFDCRVWVEKVQGQPLRHIFFGLHADVAAAHYLYDLVSRAFETETDAFRAGAVYAGMEGERRSATTSFQLGLATGICRKLRALQAARGAHLRSASGRDLVTVKAGMVDEEVAKLGLSLHTRRTPGGKRVLSDAYDAGQAAGARFEVTPGLSHAA